MNFLCRFFDNWHYCYAEKRVAFRGTLLLGMGTGLMLPMLLSVIEARELSGLRGYMVAGISYLLKEDNLDIYSFFRIPGYLAFL